MADPPIPGCKDSRGRFRNSLARDEKMHILRHCVLPCPAVATSAYWCTLDVSPRTLHRLSIPSYWMCGYAEWSLSIVIFTWLCCSFSFGPFSWSLYTVVNIMWVWSKNSHFDLQKTHERSRCCNLERKRQDFLHLSETGWVFTTTRWQCRCPPVHVVISQFI